MPKENVFHQRRVLFAKLNDIEAKIPIIVAATAEELSQPENHFEMTEEEKKLSRLQLFIKKGKMFAYNDKQPITKMTKLANNSIIVFGKPQPMVPTSIMQNEELFSVLKENANKYLEKVLKVPIKKNSEEIYLEDKISIKGNSAESYLEKKVSIKNNNSTETYLEMKVPIKNNNSTETYLEKMVEQLYQIIKNANPRKDEVIHLVTTERDLLAPNASKNRLTAEFSTLILTELRKKIAQNNDSWKVELDRVLTCIQRTSRAESHGIHRLAQQPLLLYQSRNIEEEITPKEKVIIVDDHIQTGTALSSGATEIMDSKANLLSIVCITAHKNCKYFNIQPEVKEFITHLLPHGEEDLPRLNAILKNIRLDIESLTNIEGLILSAILCDPKNENHQSSFENLLKRYDISDEINYSLFKNQKNSLMEEFEKPQVAFADFEDELLDAIKKGRFTLPYTKQMVLSDEGGQNISKESAARANLPWLLFDFDGTLHHLNDNTFTIFQDIIKKFSGVEIPLDTIKKTRQVLKESDQYQYQNMLISLIRQHNPKIQISYDDITKAYEEYKNAEPFIPKMCKKDFLMLRNKYRIGIITDGATFEGKIPKIKAFYGVDIDGYIHHEKNLPKKPNAAMYHEFCKTYNVKDKPIVYVGDSKDLDGGMAKNVNLKFISVDPTQPMINMIKFTKELNVIEEQRKATRKRWELLRNSFITKIATNEHKKKSSTFLNEDIQAPSRTKCHIL